MLWLCSLILAVDLAFGLHIKGVTALYVLLPTEQLAYGTYATLLLPNYKKHPSDLTNASAKMTPLTGLLRQARCEIGLNHRRHPKCADATLALCHDTFVRLL